MLCRTACATHVLPRLVVVVQTIRHCEGGERGEDDDDDDCDDIDNLERGGRGGGADAGVTVPYIVLEGDGG